MSRIATSQGDALKARAAKVIPKGVYGHQSVQAHSRRTPQFFARARGAHVWDYDENRYIDYLCAFGPNLLGYAHPAIDEAYQRQMRDVDTCVGPSARMVELAEAYVEQFQHAQWAMFCKNGTDATTIGLMSARAFRNKRKVLRATGAYHGATTWCTPMEPGTLPEEKAHFINYEYGNVDSLRAAAELAGDDLAGVIATPFRHEVIQPQFVPEAVFAQEARALCDRADALLILDDVRAGLRLSRECSWAAFGVAPDLVAWGKTLANGHALSAVTGNERSRPAASDIFVTGSFWMGAAALAAGLETLSHLRTSDYLEVTVRLGERLRAGLEGVARQSGLSIDQTGPAQMPLIMINGEDGER
ncbi:MAG: aminotransferase class III-fold pyridoxal phosphate-dependent enzyme, partial [Pseudomonadota bacterium]